MSRKVKIIGSNELVEQMVEDKVGTTSTVFSGTVDSQAEAPRGVKPLIEQHVIAGSTKWKGSAGQFKLYREIKNLQDKLLEKRAAAVTNAAMAPTQAELDELLAKKMIDVTRRAQEIGDMTSFIARETVNYDFDKSVMLRDLFPYVGEFRKMSGTNDSVPLIEQALGGTRSVLMEIYGLGWKDSLDNYLFNNLYQMELVNEAFAHAYVDRRNANVPGAIAGASFDDTQKVSASSVGNTYDIKLYNTILNAIKKIKTLKDILNDRKITSTKFKILANTVDAFDLARVIDGQLTSGGTKGDLNTLNMRSLASYIPEIGTFDRGNTDGYTYAKKTLSYPGVTQGKFYLFVPDVFWVLTKRPLSMAAGTGSVLNLSKTEMAAFTCGATWSDRFFGSSVPTLGKTGYGYVVEVAMPTNS
ncbi:MAG: hypothetical protein WC175_04285 [Candidatus Dojkabacteria bacterium]